MNNTQAFARGFIKAAVDQGIHPGSALALLKQAGALSDFANYPANRHSTLETGLLKSLTSAGMGAIGGAGFGGVAGYAAGSDKDPQKDHSTRDAILGALGGGVLGGAGGGLYGVNQMVDQIGALEKANPMAHQLWQQMQTNPPGSMR